MVMPNIGISKKIIGIIAGIVSAAAIFSLLLLPLSGKVGVLGRQVKALEEELTVVRRAVAAKDQFQNGGRVLTRREISRAIDEMTKVGTFFNISFLSTSPKNIMTRPDAKYPVLPIEMKLQAEYKDLGLFLGALEGMKDGIATVKRFDITTNQEILPRINAELTVEIYLKEGESE